MFKTKYISLKKAAKIFGYSSDYIGWLIRKGKIKGRKVYSGVSCRITKEAILNYKKRKHCLNSEFKRPVFKHLWRQKRYISLKEAAKISGYNPDYIGWLFRTGKIPGKKVYNRISWQTTEEEIRKYQRLRYNKNRQKSQKFTHIRRVQNLKGLNPNWIRAFYLFLRASKYASALIIMGIIGAVVSGGIIVWATTPKTQTVEVYPTQYEGDPANGGTSWQNMEQGLERQLSCEAEFSEFNKENSAYLPALPPPKALQASLPRLTNGQVKAGLSEEEGYRIEASKKLTKEEEFRVLIKELEKQLTEYQKHKDELERSEKALLEKEALLEDKPEGLHPQLEDRAGREELQEQLIKLQEQLNRYLTFKEELQNQKQIPQEEISIFTNSAEVIFSNFVLPEKNAELKKARVGFSLAAKGRKNEDDQILVDWSIDGENWANLATLTLDKEYSPSQNLGYFYFDIREIDWKLLKHLRIKFTALTNNFNQDGNPQYLPIYLDGVWLEATYQEQEQKGKPRVRIKDSSLLVSSIEGTGFRSDEEPVFIISEPEMSVQELINRGEAEVIDENTLMAGNLPVSRQSEPPALPSQNSPNISDSLWISEIRQAGKGILEKHVEKAEKGIEKVKEIFEETVEKIISRITPKAKAQTDGLQIKVFEPEEKPKEKIEYQGKSKITPRFVNNKEKFETKILKPERGFKPGLYKIEIELETEEAILITEHEFTWGVLAININKSIFLPNEEAYLQMGVLDDKGHTICNAKLELKVKSPKLKVTEFSTEDGTIQRSDECGSITVTNTPDYYTYYSTPDEFGLYEMRLTAITKNGVREITDSFEVRESAPFDIERIGPTRIYPPANYEMRMIVKVNQNFVGEVIETVPSSFKILNQELRIKNQKSENFIIRDSSFVIQEQGDGEKALIWQNVVLKQGDQLEIRYTFDAPDVSPYLYLLGPLRFEQ